MTDMSQYFRVWHPEQNVQDMNMNRKIPKSTTHTRYGVTPILRNPFHKS